MGFLDGGFGVSKLVGGTDKILTAIIDAVVDASGSDDSSVGGMFDKTYVSGYEYYAGLHLGVCHGPVDELRELTFRGKTGWEGVAAPGLDPVDGSGYVTSEPRDQEHPKDSAYGATPRTDPDLIIINRANLFGGERVEGGVLGIVEVMHGAPTQAINSYLDTKLKATAATDVYTPAYRGILSLVFHSNITSVKNYVAFKNLPEFIWGNSLIGTILQKNKSAKLSEAATSHTGFYWGAMTPSIKEVGVRVFRALQGWNTVSGLCWYPEKCIVIRDGEKYMNPAHIAVQCLIDLRFGMKVSQALIGQSFVKAAERFHHDDWVNEYGDTVPGEAIGLGIVWIGEDTIRNFLNDIMRYIYGNIYIDPLTGLLEIALVREVPAAHVADLPLLGPSQIEDIGVFSRPTGEETVNTITVIYTQLDNEKTEAVTKSNTAMTSIYNSIINDSVNFPGIKNATMAAEICEREVMQRCSLAATYRGLRVTRLAPVDGQSTQAAFTLHDGSAFRLTWPPHGVVDQVYRVANIKQSSLEDNYIEFDAVEDVFAITSSQYISPAPNSGWVNTNKIPNAFVSGDLKYIPLPYVTLLAAAGKPGVRSMPADTALFGIMASRDDGGLTTGIAVYTDNTDALSGLARGQICPVSELDGALPILDPLDDRTLLSQVKVKNFLRTNEYMISGAWFIVGNEKILCESIVTDTGDADYLLMTLKRGVFDSIPEAHADGDKMWWFNGVSAARAITTRYLTGDSETVYVTAVGRIGESDLLTAPSLTQTLSNDWFAPYPPANVKVDGRLLNAYPLKRFTVEWDCRDREGQSDVPLSWDAGGVPSEAGVTYTVTLSSVGPVVQLSYTDITVLGPVGSIKLEVPSNNTWKILKVWANREGVASKQVFSYTFTKFCGWGWSYSKRYGGATAGIILLPGESLPTVWLTDPLPTPRPVWGAGEWVHFDSTLTTDGLIGPGWEVPMFVTYAGESPGQEMVVEAEATRVSGTGDTTTAELHCSRLTGASGIYTFSEGAIGHQLVGRTDSTMATNYATETGVADFITAAARVTNSITYDGSQYVFCFNYGADIYTAATDTFTASSVRKGTVGSPNALGVLVRAEWINKIGANFIACGVDLNDTTKTLIASSTDLVSWTIQNSAAVEAARDKLAWVYYPPDSAWYVFGTVGDQVSGSTYGYKTTDGYTFTSVNLGCPSSAPCIGHGYVYTDNSSNWYMEVVAGPFLIRKFNTSAWVIHRSLRDPLQLAMSRQGGIPFQTTSRPGAASSGDISSYQSLIRTGQYIYDSNKAVWNTGNQYKGALLGVVTTASTGAQDHDYTLIQPVDHPYGNLVGALSDSSAALSDGGFYNSGGGYADTYGFLSKAVGQTTGYFEVFVGSGTGEILIGVVAAMGPDELSSYNTSAVIQQSNKAWTDVRLSCPGGIVRGSSYRSVSLPPLANTVVGVRLTQTGTSTTQCEFWVDDVLVATITNLLYDAVWFPVFTSAGVPLSLNLGQKTFQASTPASPLSWL
jgi:hypothetical protein